MSSESLGVWIVMDGNQDKQIDVMKKKAQVFAALISTKKVSRILRLWRRWSILWLLRDCLKSSGMILSVLHFEPLPMLRSWPRLSHTRSFKVRAYIRALLFSTRISSRKSCTSWRISKNRCASLKLVGYFDWALKLSGWNWVCRSPSALLRHFVTATTYQIFWNKTLWKFIEAHPVEIVEDYHSLPTLHERDKFLMKCFMESAYSSRPKET